MLYLYKKRGQNEGRCWLVLVVMEDGKAKKRKELTVICRLLASTFLMLCWSLSSFDCSKSCAREEEVLASNAEEKSRVAAAPSAVARWPPSLLRTKAAAAKTTAAAASVDDWKTTWQRS